MSCPCLRLIINCVHMKPILFRILCLLFFTMINRQRDELYFFIYYVLHWWFIPRRGRLFSYSSVCFVLVGRRGNCSPIALSVQLFPELRYRHPNIYIWNKDFFAWFKKKTKWESLTNNQNPREASSRLRIFLISLFYVFI